VEDAGGAGVRGAILTATNQDTNKSTPPPRTGWAIFVSLIFAVGSYNVAIEARGFAPLTKQLTVTVGQALESSAHSGSGWRFRAGGYQRGRSGHRNRTHASD